MFLVQWRPVLVHGLVARVLMHEARWRKGLLRRCRLDEGVELLEMVRWQAPVLEMAHVHHGGTGVHPSFTRRHGQRCPEAHAETQRWRVQVTSLGMI